MSILSVADPAVAGAHARLVRGDWPELAELDLSGLALSEAERKAAQDGWNRRLNAEYLAAAHLSQLAGVLLVAGVPLPYSSSVTRMALDEIRHAALCGRVVEALGGDPRYDWPTRPLLEFRGDPQAAIFRHVLGLACLSETTSLAVLDANLAAAQEPGIVRILRQIRADEALHSELGWPLCAHLAASFDPDRLRTELEGALAELDREFALGDSHEARLTPGLAALGSVTPEEHDRAVRGAREGPIARRLAQLAPNSQGTG